MFSISNKNILIIAAVVLVWYAYDAVYPTWEPNCKPKTLSSGFTIQSTISEIEDGRRAMSPPKPPDCDPTPNNIGRKIYNRFNPLKEGYSKEQL